MMIKDAKILDLWRRFKDASAYTDDSGSNGISHHRYKTESALKAQIIACESEGPIGEVIQLALQRWGEPHPITERYRELVAIAGIDPLAELRDLRESEKPAGKVLPFKLR